MATNNPALVELLSRLGVPSTEAIPMPEETVEEVVSTPEDPSMAAQAYGEFEKLPLAQQLALSVAPGTGHAIAAYETPMFAGETKEAIEEGNIPRILGMGALTGLSALGTIPGLGIPMRGIKAGVRAATKIIDDSLHHFPISKIEDTIKVNQKQVKVPEVKKAAQQLFDNEITKVDYDKIVKEYQPIQAITEMPTVPSLKRMEAALKKNQIETGIVGKGERATIDPKIFEGKEIAIRLDIPSYENSDTWIVTLHDGTGKGTAKGYAQSAVLKGDIKFKSNETTALNIARGKLIKNKKTGNLEPQSKTTIARISGTYEDLPVEDVYRRMEVELGNPDSEWVQVGMNPFRHSYFYAKEGDKVGTPITGATEVMQLGPLVLAKNPIYGKASDFKFKQGGSIVERNPYTHNMRAI